MSELLRMRFEKSGSAIYLSHLDVMRTFSRAFLRAEMPLKHSEGFNPHPSLSIAHPLSVGISGSSEILDFEIVNPELDLVSRLNAALPDGIKALEVYSPERKVREIVKAEYQLDFIYDNETPSPDKMIEFLSQEVIPYERKTKRGISTANLRDSYDSFRVSVQKIDTIRVNILLLASPAPINTKYFFDAMAVTPMKPDFLRSTRLRFLDVNGETFC